MIENIQKYFDQNKKRLDLRANIKTHSLSLIGWHINASIEFCIKYDNSLQS
jgi:hypothetical protein